MAGTSVDVTLAIRLIPPMMTSPSNTASIAPVIFSSIPNVRNMDVDILLIWGRLPVPKEERMVATAKKAPSQVPIRMIFPLTGFNIQTFLHIIHGAS